MTSQHSRQFSGKSSWSRRFRLEDRVNQMTNQAMRPLQGIEVGPSCGSPLKQTQLFQTLQTPRGREIVHAGKLLNLPARDRSRRLPQGTQDGNLTWGTKKAFQIYA